MSSGLKTPNRSHLMKTEEIRERYATYVTEASGVAERVNERNAEFDAWLSAVLKVERLLGAREALIQASRDANSLADDDNPRSVSEWLSELGANYTTDEETTT